MSGALDNKARATAEKLLKKFGKVATYRKVVQGVYDVNTGTMTNTNQDTSVTVYIDKVSSGDITSGIATADDVNIMVSSKELGAVNVASGDKIIADKTYEVKKIMPTYSGEMIALYNFICVVR